MPNIAIKLEPLHIYNNLFRKGQTFDWTDACQESFNEMKQILCSQPILNILDPNLPTRMYTDASILEVGAVLKQPQENKEEKLVAYFSKKLNEVQKRK